MILQLDELQEASDRGEGYCTECDDLTRACTEPDATGYDCPDCEGKETVYGVETAALSGFIEVD